MNQELKTGLGHKEKQDDLNPDRNLRRDPDDQCSSALARCQCWCRSCPIRWAPTGATAIGAILLIAQDTTPGQEFFCWALKTHGGNDDLHRDSCHALDKSPGTTGWNSIAVFPRTTKPFYGQVVLHGSFGNRFGGLPSAIDSSIHANGHPLRSGIALGHCDFVRQAQGLFDFPPPLIQLPAPLFIGTADFIRHFPAMSAMGARQHPQQGPLLSGSGGGGSGGGGSGETGGGSTRPATGLFWSRGI